MQTVIEGLKQLEKRMQKEAEDESNEIIKQMKQNKTSGIMIEKQLDQYTLICLRKKGYEPHVVPALNLNGIGYRMITRVNEKEKSEE